MHAELHVVNDNFWIRLATMNDIGFAEAYMYGEVKCSDLVAVFRVSYRSSPLYRALFTIIAKIFIANSEQLSAFNGAFSWLFGLSQRFAHYRTLNTLVNSTSNVSAHYDLTNEMFDGTQRR